MLSLHRRADFVIFCSVEPDSPRCRERKTVSEDDVEFVCELQYTGAIQPTIQWSLRHSNDPLDLVKAAVYATNGKVEYRLLVSAVDRSSWPTECHISFSRQSCGEPRPAYSRTLPCSPLNDGIIFFSIVTINQMLILLPTRRLRSLWLVNVTLCRYHSFSFPHFSFPFPSFCPFPSLSSLRLSSHFSPSLPPVPTEIYKNSPGDEIANVNFLRRHPTCIGQRLRPLNRLPNFYYKYLSLYVRPNLCT